MDYKEFADIGLVIRQKDELILKLQAENERLKERINIALDICKKEINRAEPMGCKDQALFFTIQAFEDTE